MVIRPALYEDCAAVYQITMDPSVRAMSTRSDYFDYEDHCRWWDRRFSDPCQKFFVADDLSGYVRYGRVSGTQDAEIAIAVKPEARRAGLALRMLQETEALAKAELGVTRLIALVLTSNEPSQRLFEKADYKFNRWIFRFAKSHREYIKWLS